MQRAATKGSRSRASVRSWAELSSGFVEDFDEVTTGLVGRIVTELPSFEAMRPSDMLELAQEGMALLVPAIRESRPLAGREFEIYRPMTEAQAAQGVLLGDILQGWHMGFDALRTWARRRCASEPDAMLDFLDIAIPWMEGGMATSADWYRSAATHAFASDERERAAFVRRVLTGGIEPSELRTRARVFGLSTQATFHALRAPIESEDTCHALAAWLGLAGGGRAPLGLLAAVDGDVWGFAESLPEGPVGVPVGVSAAVPLHELAPAFSVATRAMDTAVALGLTGAHDVRSLGVHVAVVEDHAVGASLLERFVAPVDQLGAAGTEILNTVRAFLDNRGSFERTGSQLFVHPNTVRYRIRKYEELVGTSLRDTATMVGVWWALERRRVL